MRPPYNVLENVAETHAPLKKNFCRAASQRPLRHYEFPTGFNTYFGPERFQVGELFFAHSRELVVSSPSLFSTFFLDVSLPDIDLIVHVGIKSPSPAHYPRADLASAHGV